MNGGQRVITSDHDAPMRRVSQHPECFDRVLFQRAVENQKAGEGQVALDLVPLEVVDLYMKVNISTQRTATEQGYLIQVHPMHFLERERKHSTTSPGVPLECLIVPARNSV